MSFEYNLKQDEFRRYLSGTLSQEVSKDAQKDLTEQITEIEYSLNYDEAKGGRLRLPKESDYATRDAKGDILSFYRDSKWKICREDGKVVTLNLGNNHPELGLDLSHPLSTGLRDLQKLLVYYDLPGKDKSRKPLKANSIEFNYKMDLHFLFYLNDKGFLRGKDPKGLHLINVADLHHEILRRIDEDEGVPRVLGFAFSIAKWIRITHRVNLPDILAATFTLKQFRARGLNKAIARYVSTKKGRWQAIDFDDLQFLLNTAFTYVQDYSSDLIFVNRIYDEVYQRRVDAGIDKVVGSLWLNDSRTHDLIDKLLNHTFYHSGHTPWLSVHIGTYKKTRSRKFGPIIDTQQAIQKRPFICEWYNLIGASVFLLLLWTAMRSEELQNLKIHALKVDGAPLNLATDTILQVNSGSFFDLKRTVYKTNEEPEGAEHVLPLPKIGALAFATLIEIFRGTRTRHNSEFLLPAGGFDIHSGGSRSDRGPDNSVASGTILNWLYNFCELVGVQRHHPHQARKTLATLLISHDPNSLELIRKLLCHKNIRMTIEYIMDIPGISEEITNHMMETMHEKVIDFMTYGASGQVAGGAGNRLLDAISANPESFKGNRLPTTIRMLVSSLQSANFVIQRTPAAWCIRFPSKIPRTAPCIPPTAQLAIEHGELEVGIDVFPEPEFCKPWKCRDAAHTPKDIDTIKRSLGYANKRASESCTSAARAAYKEQAEYFQEVLNQLHHGRVDISGMNIIDSVVGFAQ